VLKEERKSDVVKEGAGLKHCRSAGSVGLSKGVGEDLGESLVGEGEEGSRFVGHGEGGKVEGEERWRKGRRRKGGRGGRGKGAAKVTQESRQGARFRWEERDETYLKARERAR